MGNRYPLVAAFVFILTFLFLPSAFAAIFQWVDEQGTIHITDYPKPTKQAAEPEINEYPSAGPPPENSASSPSSSQKAPLQPSMSIKKQADVAPVPPSPKAGPLQSAETIKPAERPQSVIPHRTIPQVQQAASPSSSLPSVPSPAPSSVPPSLPSASAPPPPAMAGSSSPAMTRQAQDQLAAAMVAGFAKTFMFAIIGLYVYASLCLYLIASKLNVTAAWTAFVPIVQIWPFFGSAGKPFWWVLLFFVPLVNVVVGVYLWMCIAENMGRNKMLGLLTLVPLANLILLGMLAFTKKEGETQPVAA